jgi:hypothetical protein
MFNTTVGGVASQIAIRTLAPVVLTCSFPFKRWGVLKFGGRGSIRTLYVSTLLLRILPRAVLVNSFGPSEIGFSYPHLWQ